MALIDPASIAARGLLPLASRPKAKEGAKAGKGRGTFRRMLDKAAREEEGLAEAGATEAADESAELGELLDGVHETGDELKRNPTMDAVLRYKESVRAFVRRIVERCFSVRESVSGGSVLKRKNYTQIAVIDGELERLAAEIISGQRDKLEILRRVDEINGLLVDLMG